MSMPTYGAYSITGFIIPSDDPDFEQLKENIYKAENLGDPDDDYEDAVEDYLLDNSLLFIDIAEGTLFQENGASIDFDTSDVIMLPIPDAYENPCNLEGHAFRDINDFVRVIKSDYAGWFTDMDVKRHLGTAVFMRNLD